MFDIDIKLADSADEFEQIHRVNHRIYAEELGQDRVDAGHRLVDRFHDHNVYVIAKLEDEVIGVMALTLPEHRFSIEDAPVDRAVIATYRDHAVEVRRLAVLPERRGSGVFLQMLDFVTAYCIGRGLRHAFISAIDSRAAMYERLGFRRFGEPFMKGSCRYHPMILGLEELVAAGLDPRLFPALSRTLAQMGL